MNSKKIGGVASDFLRCNLIIIILKEVDEHNRNQPLVRNLLVRVELFLVILDPILVSYV